MTKKIVKRTDANNETLYFYTHADAVDVGEGSSTKSLTEVIDDFTNRGFIYKGIAPVSAPLGEDKTFYIAKSGDYTAYTGIGDGSFTLNGIAVLTYATTTASGAWTKNDIVLFDDEPTFGSNNLVKSGGVQNEFALGAVYDVSAKNPTAGPNNDGKFESLSALLSDNNLNTLIPTSVRKGGMSIKFVQSSDNKYIQYRLKSQSFTTDVTQWQGVDDLTISESAVDFAITDDNKKSIVAFKNGHIFTKNFDSSKDATELHRGIMSANDKTKLNTIEQGAEVNDVETESNINYDFAITDENNNRISIFKDGHIQTKNFNSKNAVELYEDLNGLALGDIESSAVDMSVSDESNNTILYLHKGDVFLKNFSSKRTNKKINNIETNLSNQAATNDDFNNRLQHLEAAPQTDVDLLTSNIMSQCREEFAPIGHADVSYTPKRKIKIFFIGNSVSQDHVGYLPWLFRQLYKDEVDFTIANFYYAGRSIKNYVEDFITGNTPGLYSHVNSDIFNISAQNAIGDTEQKYDDLEDALGTNGANVPDGARYGGMAVKFLPNCLFSVTKAEEEPSAPAGGTSLENPYKVTTGVYTASKLNQIDNISGLTGNVGTTYVYYYQIDENNYTVWTIEKINNVANLYEEWTFKYASISSSHPFTTVGNWAPTDDTIRWTQENNVYLPDAITRESWDVISIQSYSNDDPLYAPTFVEWLKNNSPSSFELAFLMYQNFHSDYIDEDERRVATAIVKDNPVTMLFAPYFCMKEAMKYWQVSGVLSPSGDGTHLREGLPVMITGMHLMSVICKKIGLLTKVINNRLMMTSQIWNTLNIPGPNGRVDDTMNTNENYTKAQYCAVHGTRQAEAYFNSIINSAIEDYIINN